MRTKQKHREERSKVEVTENIAGDNSQALGENRRIMDIFSEIIKKNKSFMSMTKLERRVALAQDVLASLKADKYIASQGTYYAIKNYDTEYYPYNSHQHACQMDGNELVENIKNDKQCKVCAIGSLFVSKVKAHGMGKSLLAKREFGDEDMVAAMIGIFSKKDMRMLEYFFEGKDIRNTFGEERIDSNGDHYYEGPIKDVVNKFHRQYGSQEAKLSGIMENIVKNKGEFIYKDIKI